MTEIDRKGALGKGDKAYKQKWKVLSMLRAPGAGGVAGVSGALVTSKEQGRRGEVERCQGHGLKSAQEGFRFAWKRIFLQGV